MSLAPVFCNSVQGNRARGTWLLRREGTNGAKLACTPATISLSPQLFDCTQKRSASGLAHRLHPLRPELTKVPALRMVTAPQPLSKKKSVFAERITGARSRSGLPTAHRSIANTSPTQNVSITYSQTDTL